MISYAFLADCVISWSFQKHKFTQPIQHFQRPVSFKLARIQLRLMLGFGEIRIYVLDDLLRRLGKVEWL